MGCVIKLRVAILTGYGTFIFLKRHCYL